MICSFVFAPGAAIFPAQARARARDCLPSCQSNRASFRSACRSCRCSRSASRSICRSSIVRLRISASLSLGLTTNSSPSPTLSDASRLPCRRGDIHGDVKFSVRIERTALPLLDAELLLPQTLPSSAFDRREIARAAHLVDAIADEHRRAGERTDRIAPLLEFACLKDLRRLRRRRLDLGRNLEGRHAAHVARVDVLALVD